MWDVKPGDKVALKEKLSPACYERASRQGHIIPELGNVYTVREALIGYDGKEFRPGIRLVEIQNPLKQLLLGPSGQTQLIEVSFALSKFRPVISTKGMETLRSLLDNPKLIKEINPLDIRKVKVE